jgi:hypothetical protein
MTLRTLLFFIFSLSLNCGMGQDSIATNQPTYYMKKRLAFKTKLTQKVKATSYVQNYPKLKGHQNLSSIIQEIWSFWLY